MRWLAWPQTQQYAPQTCNITKREADMLTLRLLLVLFVSFVSMVPQSADATWRPEYGNNPVAIQRWFKQAEPTLPAQQRLKINKCCEKAERLMTKFVNLPGMGWMYYPDPGCTTRGCALLPILDDVVHEGEIRALEPQDDNLPQFKQMRQEGVLFIYNGAPSCFWYPRGNEN